jgi:hypothetical protein
MPTRNQKRQLQNVPTAYKDIVLWNFKHIKTAFHTSFAFLFRCKTIAQFSMQFFLLFHQFLFAAAIVVAANNALYQGTGGTCLNLVPVPYRSWMVQEENKLVL